MFNSVKMKLTIMNLAVVGIIMLIFFTGIYILMKQNITRQSEQLLRSAAIEARNREQPPGAARERHWGNWFYVKYDSVGNVIGKTKELPVSDHELETLLGEAVKQGGGKGFIKLGAGSFRYLWSFPPGLKEAYIVFQNAQPEEETLKRLGTILIFIFLAGMAVVLLCSLFLAEKALIPIKKSWERQRNFVADASHELRSPLAVMQTNLELVMGNREDSVESQMKWLENIQAENKRMTKLVSDLLLLARADSDQQVMEKRLFPLREAVENSVAAFEPVAETKNIQMNLQLQDGIYILGDEDRIKQLTVILVDNAVKYTPSGGQISVSLKKKESHAELIVADTGEGIESAYLDKIFERFYRIDKSRSRESGGTGLGLSIARWIVNEHRGGISVYSTPGKGSTFKVVLPVAVNRA